MSMDFNDAEPQGQGNSSAPIPAGTIAPVIINVRGIKASSRNARVQGLDLEFTVTDGPYKGRKAWQWAGIAGTDSEGHQAMIRITKSFVRGILESTSGVEPSRTDAAAIKARQIKGWDDLDGVVFLARFDVEPGGEWTDQRTGEVRKGKDKNTLAAVTPDDPDYAGFKPGAPPAAPSRAPAASNGANRPSWA